jgi:pre-mRNA-splicing factor ISY1
MSRNSEKAQSMLYRHLEQQAVDQGGIVGRERRPRNVSTEKSIPMCEKWRSQVIKEINRKINKIQDPALSDFQIRDINDEINKLQREKRAWEHHLKSLGGPNYLLAGPSAIDTMGNELPTARGYKYYGRARELPGVKELFEAHATTMSERETNLRAAQRPPRDLNATYFGFVDDDPLIIAEEKEHSRELREQMLLNTSFQRAPPLEPLYKHIPTLEEVEDELIKRRRQKISEDYLSDNEQVAIADSA